MCDCFRLYVAVAALLPPFHSSHVFLITLCHLDGSPPSYLLNRPPPSGFLPPPSKPTRPADKRLLPHPTSLFFFSSRARPRSLIKDARKGLSLVRLPRAQKSNARRANGRGSTPFHSQPPLLVLLPTHALAKEKGDFCHAASSSSVQCGSLLRSCGGRGLLSIPRRLF